jgi:hypothetical protein
VEQREAEQQASRLNDEHPERDVFRWVALPHKNGVWTVVKAPRGKRVDPLKATTEAKPRPPQPGDQRSNLGRIPGYGL